MKSGVKVIGLIVLSFLLSSGLSSCGLSFNSSDYDTSIILSQSSSSSSSSQTPINSDPYIDVNTAAFYSSYKKAVSYTDAKYRSRHNLMSGDINVPQLSPSICPTRLQEGGKVARNYSDYYTENNMAYNVVDYLGNTVDTIYYGGAYITLEEVAAYLYAFGDVPANYIESNKTSSLSSSGWGEYLRLNHRFFSDDTSKFLYEPELPDAYTGKSTSSGTKKYYEIDIGTTGYDGSDYKTASYNTGSKITRGIARIVYTRYWAESETELSSPDDRYVFYTQNHYNDFREYLNYQNGWGTIFGNETGGGTNNNPSSDYKTPYPSTGTINL